MKLYQKLVQERGVHIYITFHIYRKNERPMATVDSLKDIEFSESNNDVGNFNLFDKRYLLGHIEKTIQNQEKIK